MSKLTFELQATRTSLLELKLGQYMVGAQGSTGQDGPPGPPGTLTPEDTATLDKAVSDSQAAANAAAGSATNSAQSATNAATSATNASNSAGDASASATAASNSASASANSAGAASTSATAAGNSQSAAAGSATAAGNSATAAASSQSAAHTSETNAAASAAAALASQNAAKTSETNSKTSETNAATSATNAANSAAQAATNYVAKTGSTMTGQLTMKNAVVMFQDASANMYGYLGAYGAGGAGGVGNGIGFVDHTLTYWNFQVNDNGNTFVRGTVTSPAFYAFGWGDTSNMGGQTSGVGSEGGTVQSSGIFANQVSVTANLFLTKKAGYTNGTIAAFLVNNTNVGNIGTNGTGTTYGTTSDYRLKENVRPLADALGSVARMRPIDFVWKASGAAEQGFLAHELQAVVPVAVVGTKDAVNEDGSINPQCVDYSKLVPLLVGAIQELAARVAALEGGSNV